jgi:signal transduction histidine kinase
MTNALRILSALRAITNEESSTEVMLRALVQATVPAFADWCVLDTRRSGLDPSLHFVLAHVDPKQAAVLERAASKLGPGEHLFGDADEAERERRPILRPDDVASSRDGEVAAPSSATSVTAAAAKSSNVSATLSIPLLSRGEVRGTVSFGRSCQHFADDEVELALEIAARVASSVDVAHERMRADATRASRDDMLSVLVHDLRTPLSTLGMVAARLRKNQAVRAAAQGETEVLTRTVTRVDTFLRNLVDCGRLDSGTLRIESRRVDVAAIVSSVVDAARPMATGRVIEFERPAPTEPACEIIGDSARIKQVVDRLVHNAMRFAGDGGAVLVRVTQSGGEVVVSVSDSGNGIPRERLSEIFVPSWTLPAKDRLTQKGPRLGLFVSRGLVEAHGGRLWAESAPGHGSTFTFAIPSAEASSPELKPQVAAASHTQA